jgi:type IV pilus assembly protein PilA
MVSQVESCFATEQTYVNCDTAAKLEAGEGAGSTGLDIGTGTGQVAVSAPTTTGYVVTAKSKSGNSFVITKSAGGNVRSCTTVGKGACPSSGNW